MGKKKIKIGILGIGNCSSSLIQGINFYSNPEEGSNIPGLLHAVIGGYEPGDIEVVCAFDIDSRKIGKDVSEAIFQKPNNAKVFYKSLKPTGTIVLRGPTFDGYPEHFNNYDADIRTMESKSSPVDVTQVLKQTQPDILINYLPVGSQKATEYYVNCCLEAGVSFANAIPVFICSEQKYIDQFAERGLVCAGDDIKSQVGATIVHRVLTNLFEKKGVRLLKTYQLNIGGNTDFLNMLEQTRLTGKRISKTQSIQSELSQPLEKRNLHTGPSDFVEWMEDNKVAYIRMEGIGFGNLPITLDVKVSVEDSPNSAGVMIDVIRVCKLALDNGIKGYLDEISSFSFKHPLHQYSDSEAAIKLEEFLKKMSK